MILFILTSEGAVCSWITGVNCLANYCTSLNDSEKSSLVFSIVVIVVFSILFFKLNNLYHRPFYVFFLNNKPLFFSKTQ